MTSRLPGPRSATCALVFAVGSLLACTESGPPDPAGPVVVAAARQLPPPKVNEAVPPEAPQDTRLWVQVLGSGFDPGSSVRFLLSGEGTEEMIVDSTQVVDGSTIDIFLTVTLNAPVALYDIEVMTARGKKGIGSELFAVKDKNAPWVDIPVAASFEDAEGVGLLSDGKSAYDAVILDIGNVFLDARVTAVDPSRVLCFDFAGQPDAPAVQCDHGYFSTADPTLEGGLTAMSTDDEIKTTAQATWVKDRYNWFLRFGEQDCGPGTPVEDNRAVVTHPDANTWVLKGTRACLLRMPTRGKPVVERVDFFDMPFELTLTR